MGIEHHGQQDIPKPPLQIVFLMQQLMGINDARSPGHDAHAIDQAQTFPEP